MILFILCFIHKLWHKLHLKNCFWIAKLEIKYEHRKCKCWECKFFNGFYYDNYTFDCKKEGTVCWSDIENDKYYCLHLQKGDISC